MLSKYFRWQNRALFCQFTLQRPWIYIKIVHLKPLLLPLSVVCPWKYNYFEVFVCVVKGVFLPIWEGFSSNNKIQLHLYRYSGFAEQSSSWAAEDAICMSVTPPRGGELTHTATLMVLLMKLRLPLRRFHPELTTLSLNVWCGLYNPDDIICCFVFFLLDQMKPELLWIKTMQNSKPSWHCLALE